MPQQSDPRFAPAERPLRGTTGSFSITESWGCGRSRNPCRVHHSRPLRGLRLVRDPASQPAEGPLILVAPRTQTISARARNARTGKVRLLLAFEDLIGFAPATTAMANQYVDKEPLQGVSEQSLWQYPNTGWAARPIRRAPEYGCRSTSSKILRSTCSRARPD